MTTEGLIGTWRRSRARQSAAVMVRAAPDSQFDGRAMTPEQWIAYCRELRAADALLSVQTVVVHHSVTSEYTSLTIEKVMSNWWAYYTRTKGWKGAPHGAIFSRGIGLLNVMTADGIHCAGNNVNSRGFEIMGNFTSVLPSGQLLDNAVLVFAGCLYAGKMGIDALHMHREYSATACPGNKLAANWAWFKGLVEAKWKWFYDTEEPEQPPEPEPPTLEERMATLESAAANLAAWQTAAEPRLGAAEQWIAEWERTHTE